MALTLVDAISAVEKSQTALTAADTADAAAIQKLNAALAVKAQADQDDSVAIDQANADLDALIQIAGAAKRPVVPNVIQPVGPPVIINP